MNFLRSKKGKIIAGIAVIFFLVLTIGKDYAIKVATTTAITEVTGAPASIRRLSLGIVKQSLDIQDFKIYNPQGFGEGVLADISLIHVDANLFALLKKNLRFEEIVLDIKEILIVKDKEGNLNVDALKVADQEGI